MSNRDKINQKGKSKNPTTVTVVESEPTNELTPFEEKVIRMRHGLSEDDDHILTFAVGASHETKCRLALMEEVLLSTFYQNVKDLE